MLSRGRAGSGEITSKGPGSLRSGVKEVESNVNLYEGLRIKFYLLLKTGLMVGGGGETCLVI